VAEIMVELNGSEKQVIWANDIRRKLVDYLEDVLNTITNINAYSVWYEKDVELFKTEEQFLGNRDSIQQLIDAASIESSAKFFIDNRDNLLDALVDKYETKRAFHKILTHYGAFKEGKIRNHE